MPTEHLTRDVDNGRRRVFDPGSVLDMKEGSEAYLPAGSTYIGEDLLEASAGDLNEIKEAETDWPTLVPSEPAISVGEEVGDVINVLVQLRDIRADNVEDYRYVECYLSDDPDGIGLTAAAPDGDIASGDYGTIIYEPEADKVFKVLTDDAGLFDLDIGESGGGTWYLVVTLGWLRFVSDAITFVA